MDGDDFYSAAVESIATKEWERTAKPKQGGLPPGRAGEVKGLIGPLFLAWEGLFFQGGESSLIVRIVHVELFLSRPRGNSWTDLRSMDGDDFYSAAVESIANKEWERTAKPKQGSVFYLRLSRGIATLYARPPWKPFVFRAPSLARIPTVRP